MTRRYLNPAWKNRSTEELERALLHALRDQSLTPTAALVNDELIHTLEQELAYRLGGRAS